MERTRSKPDGYLRRSMVEVFDQHINITLPLENTIISHRGTNVKFLCKTDGFPLPQATWYRNGTAITPSPRMIIKSERITLEYSLELFNIDTDDQGLYTVMLRNRNDKCMSSSRLYIIPEGPCLLHHPSFSREFYKVIKHLSSIVVMVNHKIELNATYASDAKCYFWFKNDDLIVPNLNTTIVHEDRSSTLTILNASLSDSGVYSLIKRTLHGHISSSCEVSVTLEHPDNHTAPHVVGILKEFSVNEGEDAELVIKCNIAVDTLIEWESNHQMDERFERIDYGEGYIGLRIIQTTKWDCALYRLTIADDTNRLYHSKVLGLDVVSLHEQQQPIETLPPTLISPLLSVNACIGAKVFFFCQYSLPINEIYHVVWRVGRYKVVKNNSEFYVTSSRGANILYIPTLEPSMAGEVSCEVRRRLPKNRSKFVERCFANLAILPPKLLSYELSSGVYQYEEAFKDSNKVLNTTKKPPTNSNPITFECRRMNITYCRYNDGNYFLLVTRLGGMITNQFRVDLLSSDGEDNASNVITVLEWDPAVLPLTGSYFIKVCDHIGNYTDIGVTRVPSFEIRGLPSETIVKFRIGVNDNDNVIDGRRLQIWIGPKDGLASICQQESTEDMDAFNAQFVLAEDSEIGSGAFGNVRLVRRRNQSGGSLMAAKYIEIANTTELIKVAREASIMRKLNHPNLVSLIGSYTDGKVMILVMEYLSGGELLDSVDEVLKETEAITYVRQLLEALKYMHGKYIGHLDIKPENTVFVDRNSTLLKIVDFGLARDLSRRRRFRTLFGTEDYLSPEILKYNAIKVTSDMWSMGVFVYYVLSGLFPFRAKNWSRRVRDIKQGNFNYTNPAFQDVSELAQDFINKLLVVDPTKRMTAEQALLHPWMNGGLSVEMPMSQAQRSSRIYLDTTRRWSDRPTDQPKQDVLLFQLRPKPKHFHTC